MKINSIYRNFFLLALICYFNYSFSALEEITDFAKRSESDLVDNSQDNYLSKFITIQDIQKLVAQYADEWYLCFQLDISETCIENLIFSPCGNFLVSLSPNCINDEEIENLKIWNFKKIADDSKRLVIKNDFDYSIFNFHHSSLCGTLAYSLYGNFLAINPGIGARGSIKILNMKTKKWLAEIEKKIRNLITYSPYKDCLFISSDTKINIFNSSTLQNMRYINNDSTVDALAVSPCGTYLASSQQNDFKIKVWNIEKLYETSKVKLIPLTIKTNHKDSIHILEYSPCGKYLLSSSFDNTIKIWTIGNIVNKIVPSSKINLITLTGHEDCIEACKISSCGNYLISCSDDKSVKWWDFKMILAILNTRANQIIKWCTEYSQDSKYCIASYNIDCGDSLLKSISISPCSQYLAVGFDKIEIYRRRIYDLLGPIIKIMKTERYKPTRYECLSNKN